MYLIVEDISLKNGIILVCCNEFYIYEYGEKLKKAGSSEIVPDKDDPSREYLTNLQPGAVIIGIAYIYLLHLLHYGSSTFCVT